MEEKKKKVLERKSSESHVKNQQNNVTFLRLIFHLECVAQVEIFAPTSVDCRRRLGRK